MRFGFHAAPPPGEWLNDPNGLCFADGRYRLFAQHSADAPDFKSIGWARMSSDDLLDWDWDDRVIPPDATGMAYSGSLMIEDGLTAFLTRHAPPAQRQYRLSSNDAGRSWQQDASPLGPEARNVRDPFVFHWGTDSARYMLLAEPCDWTGWRNEAASTISVWRADGASWTRTGTIGPWLPEGVMWEVPNLVTFGDEQFLIVSLVDRREDGATCSVRAWRGRFDGTTFVRDDCESELLDHGPDFYATCWNTVDNWPDASRVMVAWASSWATARTMAWPGGVNGGPITLPRKVISREGRLRQVPITAARALATTRRWENGEHLALKLGDNVDLSVAVDGAVSASRRRPWWQFAEPMVLAASTDILVFEDNGLFELFFVEEGRTMTIFAAEMKQ